MSDRLHEIAQRRRMLVAEAAHQRAELAANAAALRQSFDWLDMLRRGGHVLRSRPLVVGAFSAGLALVGPRRVLRLVYRSGLMLPVALRVLRILRSLR